MSTYKYNLQNFHAIERAEITIEGITVLAGENGCGKSTLSKWLYYIVNEVYNFEQNLFKDYIKSLSSLIDRMYFVARNMGLYSPIKYDDVSSANKNFLIYRNSTKQLHQIEPTSDNSIEKAHDIFLQSLQIFTEHLSEFLENNRSNARRERILRYLDISPEEKEPAQAIEEYNELHQRLANRLAYNLHQAINSRPSDAFFELIRKDYKETGRFPSAIQITEDDVEVFHNGQVSSLFNLHRAIYIDTPIALTAGETDNIFWNELQKMAMDNPLEGGTDTQKLLRRIKLLLNGETILTEDNLFDGQELRYVSNDRMINIELAKAATGFKTFSYLQRLLENGYLTPETLLLIDEPEAHLHPQWIVEYARLLVLLHKTIGLKIMMATHNPDMVAAIRSISEREGILDHTNFFLASPGDTPHKYIYKNLNHEIGEIFQSFNIALDRIRTYGTNDL